MMKTRFALWTEGAIATAILTLLLIIAFPLVALGIPESEADAEPPSISAREEQLLGTYPAHQMGLFFPPSASIYIAVPSTQRDAIGGPADQIAVPSLLEIHRQAEPIEVFRSPVDTIFELNPARTSAKPFRFEF